MPSSITHELIAKEAVHLLPAGAKRAALRAPDYYFLGAQGPDLFFFYLPLKMRDNWGKGLHREGVYEWFSAMLSSLPEKEGRAECLAYALGFCTHLAADTVFHPFVYRYLAEHGDKKFRHQRIENDWDVYFLRATERKSPIRYRFAFDLSAIGRENILAPYLAKCAKKTGRTLRPAAIKRMFSNFSRYLSHFHRARKPLALFGLKDLYPRDVPDPEVICGEDFSRLSVGKGGDADALFFAAEGEAATCISAFYDAYTSDMVLPKSLFARNLLTGEPTC